MLGSGISSSVNAWNLRAIGPKMSDVRQNLKSNNSLRRGFVNIFRITVECLKVNTAQVKRENLIQVRALLHENIAEPCSGFPFSNLR
jgi:hypothetical protein